MAKQLENQLEFDFMKEEHKAKSREDLKEAGKFWGTGALVLSSYGAVIYGMFQAKEIYESIKNLF